MDKKQMEELMKARIAPAVDRQVVKEVDLLKPAALGVAATNNQAAEAANMFSDKAPSIPEPNNDNPEAGKKRGRPRSQAKNLVHFSTWLPQELVWAIQIKSCPTPQEGLRGSHGSHKDLPRETGLILAAAALQPGEDWMVPAAACPSLATVQAQNG